MKRFSILALTVALVLTMAVPAYANNGKAVGNPHDTDANYKVQSSDLDSDDDESADSDTINQAFGNRMNNGNDDKGYDKDKVQDKDNVQQNQDGDCILDLDCNQDDPIQERIYERIMIQENDFSKLPYGLSKRTLLPYGLSKREVLPFGLEKKLWGFEEDIDDVSMDVLAEKLGDLLEEAEDVITLYSGLDYDTEINALENAMADAKTEIEKTDVTLEKLKEVYIALDNAIDVFDTLDVIDENAAALLNAQIDTIEATLNASIYGEVQGAFPVDADNDLLEMIIDVENAMKEPMTHSAFMTWRQSLQREFKAFMALQYATEDEIDAYNEKVSSYKEEVTEWFMAGEIEGTDIKVLSEDFMDYYRIAYFTPLFDEDALEAKSILDERINIIKLSREALLDEEESL